MVLKNISPFLVTRVATLGGFAESRGGAGREFARNALPCSLVQKAQKWTTNQQAGSSNLSGRTISRLTNPLLFERVVGLGAGAGIPGPAVVLAAIARPGVECIDHAVEFRLEFRDGAHQHALHGRDGLFVAVGRSLLHHFGAGAVV